MIYVIAGISSFLSGLGVGGGSLFVLIAIMQNMLNLNEIRAINLAMFTSIGIVLIIKNKKDVKKNLKMIISIILFGGIGAIIGTKIGKNIDEKILKIIFNIAMLCIGIYEIIASVKCLKKSKNIIVKGEK